MSGGRALIIGAGGLGCAASLGVAKQGFGSLTLADKDPLDFCPANRTGLPCAVVHLEVILKFTASIDPVKGGSVAANAFL